MTTQNKLFKRLVALTEKHGASALGNPNGEAAWTDGRYVQRYAGDKTLILWEDEVDPSTVRMALYAAADSLPRAVRYWSVSEKFNREAFEDALVQLNLSYLTSKARQQQRAQPRADSLYGFICQEYRDFAPRILGPRQDNDVVRENSLQVHYGGDWMLRLTNLQHQVTGECVELHLLHRPSGTVRERTMHPGVGRGQLIHHLTEMRDDVWEAVPAAAPSAVETEVWALLDKDAFIHSLHRTLDGAKQALCKAISEEMEAQGTDDCHINYILRKHPLSK